MTSPLKRLGYPHEKIVDDAVEIIRYVRWTIEPPLWEDEKGKTITFKKERIRFTVEDGKIVRAEAKDMHDFEKKATDILEAFRGIYILERGESLKVTQERVGGTTWNSTAAVFVKSHADAQNEFNRNLGMLDYYENTTLRGAISYYHFALTGIDQLTVAGNLYMAMEELWNNPAFGNLKILSDKLIPHDKASSLTKLREWKKDLNQGRHAFVNGKPTAVIPVQRMAEIKQGVRRLTLAYVEWLKKNKPLP